MLNQQITYTLVIGHIENWDDDDDENEWRRRKCICLQQIKSELIWILFWIKFSGEKKKLTYDAVWFDVVFVFVFVVAVFIIFIFIFFVLFCPSRLTLLNPLVPIN